jgi:hypothetical protein
VEVIESSGSLEADLAAWLLKKEMMSLCAVIVAHGVKADRGEVGVTKVSDRKR